MKNHSSSMATPSRASRSSSRPSTWALQDCQPDRVGTDLRTSATYHPAARYQQQQLATPPSSLTAAMQQCNRWPQVAQPGAGNGAIMCCSSQVRIFDAAAVLQCDGTSALVVGAEAWPGALAVCSWLYLLAPPSLLYKLPPSPTAE